MFNEKEEEYSVKQGKNIPVWQNAKYLESRAKALEIIDSKVYGLSEADFWILMNETKTGKMAYTGLIISHNGCLKINDKLPAEQKFRPSCVSLDKEGYSGSLVYSYCCDEQGIYEVGEVNGKNCRIDYPYAMAFKRMMDRVVLKSSKLAYSGIYSEVEADEFHERLEDMPETSKDEPEQLPQLMTNCADCKGVITPWMKDGTVKMSQKQIAEESINDYGVPLCLNCIRKRRQANANN